MSLTTEYDWIKILCRCDMPVYIVANIGSAFFMNKTKTCVHNLTHILTHNSSIKKQKRLREKNLPERLAYLLL